MIRHYRYFRDVFKLALKAGHVWGAWGPFRTIGEWADAVRATPLHYELERLERERIALTGKGWT